MNANTNKTQTSPSLTDQAEAKRIVELTNEFEDGVCPVEVQA